MSSPTALGAIATAAARVAAAPVRLALAVGVLRFLWSLGATVAYPGLRLEPDRVANRVHLARLLAGDSGLADLWYFPLPKLLPVALLGPAPEWMVAFLAAAAAAGLAAAIAYVLARELGARASVAVSLLLALDPLAEALSATASADLFLSALVASAIAAWVAGHARGAAVAIALATLVKPMSAAAALPLVVDRARSARERCAVVVAAALALAATALGYRSLLGSVDAALRLPHAFAEVIGGAAPVLPWLAEYATERFGGELLPATWPLALLGLVAIARSPGTRGVRQLLLAFLGVGTAYVASALATDTVLYARFLWPVQIAAIALAGIGAVVAADLVARIVPRARAAVALFLVLAVAAGLVASARGEGGRYVRDLDGLGRAVEPFLARLAAEARAGERVEVPLWLQPAAIERLGRVAAPASVVASEARVRTRADGAIEALDADWVLVAPTLYETFAAKHRVGEETRCGYTAVATSDVPPLALVRGDPDLRAACARAPRATGRETPR